MFKRSVIIVIALMMALCLAPAALAYGGTDSPAGGPARDGGAEVTRADWLSDLVTTFEMTFEEGDAYPDNYFSDLDTESPYYGDLMKAVGFGVVNIEAGDPIDPEGAVTREFAASTLNYCLAFQLPEDMAYTFSDAADVEDPAAAQVAVDRGWLELIDGEFRPEEAVTEAERAVMFADAAEVWNSTKLDPDHVDSYEVKEGVTEVPESAGAVVAEDGRLFIAGGSQEIAEGDTFVVQMNGIPVAYTAKAVETTEGGILVETEDVSTDEAFDELDIQGTLDGSAMVIGETNPDLVITQGSSKMKGLRSESIGINDLSFTGEVELSDMLRLDITGGLTQVKVDYEVNKGQGSFIKLSGLTSLAVSVTGAIDTDNIHIFYAEVPGTGIGIDLVMEVGINGKMEVKTEGMLTCGISFNEYTGSVRLIKEFTAKNFDMACEITGFIGLKCKLGVVGPWLPINGYVYASAGGAASVKTINYPDGAPRE